MSYKNIVAFCIISAWYYDINIYKKYRSNLNLSKYIFLSQKFIFEPF